MTGGVTALAALLVVATGASCRDAAPPDAVVVAVAGQPCDTPNRQRGVGVVVGDGLVATAAHTVDGPRRSVTVDDEPAVVTAVDARTDLALLAVEGTVADRPAELSFATPSSGVIRTPDGERPVGVLRTGRLTVDDLNAGARYARQVHTLASGVAPGTSGAPLLDDDGRVLGIVVLANRTDGTAYAVTAAELAAVVDAGRAPADPERCPG